MDKAFKVLKFPTIVFVFALLAIFYGGNSVHAADANNTLPNTIDFSRGSNIYLEVADRGNGTNLKATDAVVVIEFNNRSGNQVIFEHGRDCYGSPDNKHPIPTLFQALPTTTNNPNGYDEDLVDWGKFSSGETSNLFVPNTTNCSNPANEVVLNVHNISESSRVEGRQNRYVVIIQVTHTNPGGGVNAFKIRTNDPNALIGYKGNGDNKATHAFSVQDRVSSSGTYSNFSFFFAPPCDRNDHTITLSWTDADWGSNQFNSSYQMQLIKYPVNGGPSSNVVTRSGSQLGGDGDTPVSVSNVLIEKGYKYEWRWLNVSKDNGVQFFMPYDSTSFNQTCGPPPVCYVEYSLNGGASFSDGNTVTATPGAPLTVRFRIQNTSGSTWDNRETTPGLYQIAVATQDPREGTFNDIDGSTRLNLRREQIIAGGYATSSDWNFSTPSSVGTYSAAWRPVVFPNAITSPPNNDFSNRVFLDPICPVNVIVESPPPPATLDCSASIIGTDFRAGAPSQRFTRATSSGTHNPTIITVAYSISPDNGTGMSGTGNLGSPHLQDNVTRITAPGNYTATWTISWIGQGYTTTQTSNCSASFTITIQPLVCSVSTINTDINTPFTLSLTLTNPNLIAVPINSSSWSAPGLSPPNGNGVSTSSGNWSSPAGGAVTIYSGSVQAPNTGVYSVGWTVATPWSGSNPNAANCLSAGTGTVIVREIPYARFYGNDVFAGGAYGDSCTVGGAAFARGSGRFDGGASHGTYRGSASELAIFAVNQISGVLPGSQNTSRYPLQELSFANNVGAYPTNAGTLQFGGGFGSQLCVDDFPDATGTSLSGNTDLSGLGGSYTSSGLTITGGVMPNGFRPLIVVNGDVTITGNITYATDSWGSAENIPLVRIYASGDIRIDGNVSELTGLFFSKGIIHTCTNGSNVLDPQRASDLDDGTILSRCSNKLTVYGAFTAPRVNLFRIIGSVSGGSAGEASGSGNIAESFVFSPEIYAAMLDEDRNNTEDRFDSILSLPPAF